MAMLCCLACRSQHTIFISASFVPSLLVGYRKVYSVSGEADVVMTSATGFIANNPFEIRPTLPLSLTCLNFRHSILARDRGNHLALPHCREAGRWRDGCGLQGRRPRTRSLCG